MQIDEGTRIAIQNEVKSELEAFGALYTQQPTSSPATSASFGLVLGEFTHGTPRAVDAADIYGAVLAADISEAAGAFKSAGLGVPVLAGQSWLVRYSLVIGSAAGSTNGIVLAHAAGPGGTGTVGIIAIGAGVNMLMQSAALYASLTGNFHNDYSASNSFGDVTATLIAAAAPGTFDLQFKRTAGGETYTVRAGSSVFARRIG
jgi:hypothetical protein